MLSHLYPKSRIISLSLRDTYAQIQHLPIHNFKGINDNISTSEIYPNDSLNQVLDNLEIDPDKYLNNIFASDLFLSSNDIFGYLSKNITSSMCDDIITIVINNLQDLYWNNRSLLTQEEEHLLEIDTNKIPPTFKNIFEYKHLTKYSNKIYTPIYQLYGDITPHTSLYIPVKDFIKSINIKEPIHVRLENIDIIIQLDYELYDFFNFETEFVYNCINLNKKC